METAPLPPLYCWLCMVNICQPLGIVVIAWVPINQTNMVKKGYGTLLAEGVCILSRKNIPFLFALSGSGSVCGHQDVTCLGLASDVMVHPQLVHFCVHFICFADISQKVLLYRKKLPCVTNIRYISMKPALVISYHFCHEMNQIPSLSTITT